jgi:DNA-binding HxlR family transcriptional regulator
VKPLGSEGEFEKDRERAEVFDALGHPTRILILKALSEEPLGFADLKKKTGIDSSGHLQHHLTKLNSLIKTDAYGKYCLSDQGKDALLTVQTVENASPKNIAEPEKASRRFRRRRGLKLVVVLFAVLLLVSSAVAVLEYTQTSNLHIIYRNVVVGEFVKLDSDSSMTDYVANITDGKTVVGSIFFLITSAPANSSSADNHQITCQLIAKPNYQVDSFTLTFSSGQQQSLSMSVQPFGYGYPPVDFYTDNLNTVFSVNNLGSLYGTYTQDFFFNLLSSRGLNQINIAATLSMHYTTNPLTELKTQTSLTAPIPTR